MTTSTSRPPGSDPRSSPLSRPLTGLHVVECASFVAGPTAGMTLAQLGADVVRIDPLGGGSDRHRWPVALSGESFYWSSLNRGKRSVAIDHRSDAGRELVVALATAAGDDRGILVDNVVGRRWMAHESLLDKRADLIHLRVQGYASGRPAVDYTINPEVGVPEMTGGEGPPVNHVVPAWDLLTGLTVATGILAAVRNRDRTGSGAWIEIALEDVALAGVANMGWLSAAAESGVNRTRQGNHLYGSFGVDFVCADGGRVMVVALTEGQWRALRDVTETAEVFAALEKALDADFGEEADRYRLRETIASVLRPWFAVRTMAEVTADLDAARVLWGRYNRLTDVVEAHRRGEHPVLADVTLADGTTALAARSPLRWQGEHGAPGVAPGFGEDTEAVLAEVLGLSAHDLGRLADAGVIAPGTRAG